MIPKESRLRADRLRLRRVRFAQQLDNRIVKELLRCATALSVYNSTLKEKWHSPRVDVPVVFDTLLRLNP